MRVVLDPGHGGTNTGTTAGGIIEKDVTLAICRLAKAELDSRGVPCVLTRNSDMTLSQSQRASAGVRSDLVFSIHVNALESRPEVSGVECYIWPGLAKGRRGTAVEGDGGATARRVSNELLMSLSIFKPRGIVVATRDRGDWIKNARAILKAHAGVTVLVEAGFATSPIDLPLIKSHDGQMDIAQSIANAAERWYRDETRT